ncbi:putative ATP-dependent RNA helicase DDX28 [Crassostrea virginica]
MIRNIFSQRCQSCVVKTITRQVSTKEIPELTIPMKMVRNIEKVKLQKIIQEESQKQQRKGALLISCKNKKYNFYASGRFDPKDPKALASHGWKHRKSYIARDFFTFNAVSTNPALLPRNEQCTFSDLKISEEVCQRLRAVGIEQPTDVQKQTIPEVLYGNSVLCAAQTGSGKTLAYLLPIIDNLIRQRKHAPNEMCNAPQAVILVPAKELVHQLMEVAVMFEDLLVVRALAGGQHINTKLMYMKSEPIDIFIATPGAFKKFLSSGKISYSQLQHLVLDEADTLLDDSFFPDIRFILARMHVHGGVATDSRTSTGTQLNLVSATMPRDLQRNIGALISMETITTITSRCLHSVLPHITQTFIRVKKSDKPGELLKMVRQNVDSNVPTMVFCNKSATSYFVRQFLVENSIPSTIINSELRPQFREGKFHDFQSEKSDVIVCTDIASRGLDTIRARHVVNYDFPDFVSDYIHRCGRVGRVGSQGHGKVTSFISSNWEVELLWQIETAVRKKQPFHNVNANIKRKLKGVEG